MSVLTSRKSSSTPSLNEVNDNKPSVAATEQASSADNLTQTVKSVSGNKSLNPFFETILSQFYTLDICFLLIGGLYFVYM